MGSPFCLIKDVDNSIELKYLDFNSIEHGGDTPTRTLQQRLLEAEHGKDIGQITTSTLEAHRGQPKLVLQASMDLGVTGATLYNWCHALGITISYYSRWRDVVEHDAEQKGAYVTSTASTEETGEI